MRPYRHEIKYYECDRMGVTHHSNYIRFMEEARIDWMDQLGFGFEELEAEGLVSPVVNLSCNYHKSTTFKDVLTIELKVREMTGLKITFNYAMKVGDKLVCTAASTHCFLENGRPVVIRERLPNLYDTIVTTQQL